MLGYSLFKNIAMEYMRTATANKKKKPRAPHEWISRYKSTGNATAIKNGQEIKPDIEPIQLMILVNLLPSNSDFNKIQKGIVAIAAIKMAMMNMTEEMGFGSGGGMGLRRPKMEGRLDQFASVIPRMLNCSMKKL